MSSSLYNYDKGQPPPNQRHNTTGMHQSDDQARAPAPDERAAAEEIEVLKGLLAEAKALCAQYVVAMFRESRRAWREAQQLLKEMAERGSVERKTGSRQAAR